MTTTAPKASLLKLSTAALIAQYDAAVSSHAGRHTEHGPRQQRINYIVDLLSDRADQADEVALKWFNQTS